MSFLFDEVNDYATITDNAALSLPSGDWSLGCWIKLSDNTGGAAQYFLSWGGFNEGGAVNLQCFVREASAVDPDEIDCSLTSDNLSVLRVTSTSGVPGTSTNWQHILLVKSGTTLTLYVDGASAATDTDTSFDGLNVADTFYIARRNDGDAARYFGGYIAEIAKWDRALSTAEIAAVSSTAAPIKYPTSLAWYVDAIDGFDEAIVPLTVTAQNEAATNSEHPTLSYGASADIHPIRTCNHLLMR